MRIYVGNLSYDVTEEQLRQEFVAYGEVASVSILTDRISGRPKGFGFVEMGTEEAASEAIGRLNGQTLDGRELNVAEARPPRQRDDRGGRRGYDT